MSHPCFSFGPQLVYAIFTLSISCLRHLWVCRHVEAFMSSTCLFSYLHFEFASVLWVFSRQNICIQWFINKICSAPSSTRELVTELPLAWDQNCLHQGRDGEMAGENATKLSCCFEYRFFFLWHLVSCYKPWNIFQEYTLELLQSWFRQLLLVFLMFLWRNKNLEFLGPLLC